MAKRALLKSVADFVQQPSFLQYANLFLTVGHNWQSINSDMRNWLNGKYWKLVHVKNSGLLVVRENGPRILPCLAE